MKNGSKLLRFLLTVAVLVQMGLAVGSVQALDEHEIAVGELRLISHTPLTAQDYEYAGNTLLVTGRTALTISGTTQTDRVVVADGASASVTLDNLQIDLSATAQACALDMSGAEVTLRLKGENRLLSGFDNAGLRVGLGASLTVSGTGSLSVTGGNGGAGIGGGRGEAGGEVFVQSGTLRAFGGDFSAGIGGGDGGACGSVIITGGMVDALGGNSGAGIGSGWNADGGMVMISGGTVTTAGGYTGAGIGGGWNGSAGTVTVSGGVVQAEGGQDGIGIGHGRDGSGGSFSTGENGTAFLSASQISDRSDAENWSGIIFESAKGFIYGDQTLLTAVTVGKKQTLTITQGRTLTIAESAELVNDGTITVRSDGILINEGRIFNKGTLTNHGTINNYGNIVGVVDGTPPAWPEQFTEGVTLGATYYFDLSAFRDVIGMVNEGGESYDGVYASVPDTTLHYVPFTYTGTLLAGSGANSSLRSLFLSDFVISRAVSWDNLHDNGLINGSAYQSAGVRYLLRAPSGGSAGQDGRAIPIQNEWDRIFDKGGSMGGEWIKNWRNILSWCQERCTEDARFATLRGGVSAAYWMAAFAEEPFQNTGFRPVLEIVDAYSAGADALKTVTLHLNGGRLPGTGAELDIVVRRNQPFAPPPGDGLIAPHGMAFSQWTTDLAGMNTQISAQTDTLYAQWKAPVQITPSAAIDYRSERLTGLQSGAVYLVSGQGQAPVERVSQNGSLPLEQEHFGETILLVHKGDDGLRDSEPQRLQISARPSKPQAVLRVVKAYDRLRLDGAKDCELSIDGSAWQTENTVYDLLPDTAHTVLVRKAATADSFASENQMYLTRTLGEDGAGVLQAGESTWDEWAMHTGDGAALRGRDGDLTASWSMDARDTVTLLPAHQVLAPVGAAVQTHGSTLHILQGEIRVDREGRLTAPAGGSLAVPGQGGMVNIHLARGGTVAGVGDGALHVSEGTVVQCGATDPITIPEGGGVVTADGEVRFDITVIFDTGGGTAVATQRVPRGQQAQKPADPQKEGHQFVGWYRDRACTQAFNFADAISEEITLYARWEVATRTFTLRFDTTGGEAIEPIENIAEGQTVSLPVPTRAGFAFAGWYTARDGGERITDETPITQDVTLYARWEVAPRTFTLRFDTTGGEAIAPIENIAEGQTVLLPVPTRAGFAFAGWYTSRDGGERITDETPITQDATLYARWDAAPEEPDHKPEPPAGGGIGGGAPPTAIVPEKPDKSPLLLAVAAIPDGSGVATATVPDMQIEQALEKANGQTDTESGITIVIQVDPRGAAKTLHTVFSQRSVKRMLEAKTERIIIRGPMLSVYLGQDALRGLARQTDGGNIVVTVSNCPAAALPLTARTLIAQRPALLVEIARQEGGVRQTVGDLPQGSVMAGITYTPGDGEQQERLLGVCIGRIGAPQTREAYYDPVQSQLIFTVDEPAVYGVGYAPTTPVFTDTARHWAEKDIAFIAENGVLMGTADKRFGPDLTMTRGMFVTALGRLCGVQMAGASDAGFADVSSRHYSAPYVAWAVEHDIAQGVGGGKFAPDSPVSREQMAVLISRFAQVMELELPQTPTNTSFVDEAAISPWARGAVSEMTRSGLLYGKADGRFDPKATATRAESAAVLGRLVALMESGGYAQIPA